MLPKRVSLIIFLVLANATAGLSASHDFTDQFLADQIFAQADSVHQLDSLNLPEAIIDSSAVAGDSTSVAVDSSLVDSVVIVPNLVGYGPDSVLIRAYAGAPGDSTGRRSPTMALFKSVLFPGWGQYSNGKYFKAALVFAVEGYFIYKAVDLGQQASDWKDRWRSAEDDNLKVEYFSRYADYRDDRNSFLWYTALTVFLSMFDAYVDAHLAPFPREIEKPEKISLDIDPADGLRVSLTCHF